MRLDFWHYDPEGPRGWEVYGQDSVNPAGVPDPGISIYAFTGAMIAARGFA